jgi:hypothetical protein
MGIPEVSKRWPAGTLRDVPGQMLICDQDGEPKSLDDLKDRECCKIKTLNTTRENYEWAYSSDAGTLANGISLCIVVNIKLSYFMFILLTILVHLYNFL